MKKAVIGAIILAIGALVALSFGNLGDNLVYYWTPGETLAKADKAEGATIRLGGVVEKGSVDWNAQTLQLKFKVADSTEAGAKSVLVNSKGAPPQMFREGIGVVVEGVLDKSGVFQSERVLVNHSNEYRPPEGGKPTANYGAKTLGKQ